MAAVRKWLRVLLDGARWYRSEGIAPDTKEEIAERQPFSF
jgi:hypothetical protein